jgi:acetate kinase
MMQALKTKPVSIKESGIIPAGFMRLPGLSPAAAAALYLYAIPYQYYTSLQIRKYGFHGTSHRYASKKACCMMNRDINQTNLITLHLGSGCSACAIEKGRCVDTSMGMTPLAGLMMGTRCGDIDPGLIKYLMENTSMSIGETDNMLNRQSGLKGISGFSDMRDIHKQAVKKNRKAILALEMFTYSVKKIIGSYTAVLDRVDALVFTGGIGENDHISRSMICNGLSGLGIIMDEHKNLRQSSAPFSVHSAQSRVQIWVVRADEEMQIAQAAFMILNSRNFKSPAVWPA